MTLKNNNTYYKYNENGNSNGNKEKNLCFIDFK